MGIIAVFYPDTNHPVQPLFLILTALAMFVVWFLKKKKVLSFWYYLILGGGISWLSMFLSGLHPALALVFIIPLFPHNAKAPKNTSTLIAFQSRFGGMVHYGLFLFGLCNAGVYFSGFNHVVFIILLSLILGKPLGVFSFGYLGHLLGFRIHKSIGMKGLFIIGITSGIGLTVSLFITEQAYTHDTFLRESAKMGSLLSVIGGGIALLFHVLTKRK